MVESPEKSFVWNKSNGRTAGSMPVVHSTFQRRSVTGTYLKVRSLLDIYERSPVDTADDWGLKASRDFMVPQGRRRGLVSRNPSSYRPSWSDSRPLSLAQRATTTIGTALTFSTRQRVYVAPFALSRILRFKTV